jgi:hypothetical protein
VSDHSLLIDKACAMLGMQDDINCRVDPDWRARDREWYRAIWIECAELMEHHGGWKWWKHGTPDLPQVVLELVDIWHFGLSLRLQQGGVVHEIARAIVSDWCAPPPALPFLTEVERLAGTALVERRFAVGSVRNLLAACECDFDSLHRSYVGKNVLNLFRQDHGYRDGRYRKTWQGREDNEVLAELLPGLDSDARDFRDVLYRALAARYALVADA